MKLQLITSRQLLLGVGLGLFIFSAHAVTFSAGDNLALPGTTVSFEPQLAGEVLVDEIIPFSYGPSGLNPISGTVQQRVVRSSVDNTIDFSWRILNDKNSDGSIESFNLSNFISPQFNANYRTDGLGSLGPDHGILSASGSDFSFLFNGRGLIVGQDSNFFFLDTTATNYAKTAFFNLTTGDCCTSNQFAAYAPAPIPEPETYAMMLAGLSLIGFAARRKL